MLLSPLLERVSRDASDEAVNAATAVFEAAVIDVVLRILSLHRLHDADVKIFARNAKTHDASEIV